MTDTFVLRQRPPLRALLVSSVVAVLAAVLIVMQLVTGWTALLVPVGIGLLVLSVGWAALALYSTRRLRYRVELDADGYRISSPGHQSAAQWKDIAEVTAQSTRVTLVHRLPHVSGDSIVCLAGMRDPDFLAIIRAVQRRLDESRGYHPGG
ncbi:hypothetical protein GCM10009841_02580 [Microlunatus panaciterrae]|uniref:PH domain-containing protein n=1 Tax=Microlunatus panaciterrae TaxID=400768 RepID=A0ABS2RJ91_9ACTN|nr:hypothetical protein [Microlunatus panaciterrae]MBM7799078.1 hypothetical protein [Microlunatus panaciterrae]